MRFRPRLLALALAAALLVPTAPAIAAPPSFGPEPIEPIDPTPVTVFVQLAPDGSTEGAAATFDSTYRRTFNRKMRDWPQAPTPSQRRATEAAASDTAADAARSRRARISDTADTIVSRARSHDRAARKMYDVTNALPGVVMTADADALAALAERSDVVKISPIVPKYPMNAASDQLTRAIDAWKTGEAGNLGEGVRVGVIDTGIDYRHADFGGTVGGSNATTWSTRNTAKIAGGWDFVGNTYTGGATPIVGDADPMDCNGHGTHVAGTLAGYGVNSGGTTFTGPYADLTAAALDDMRIAPGTAPMAELYALKVFGCEGSTSAVIKALDWALDPDQNPETDDHLDIVNLSLGSDYTTPDDPENDVINELAEHGVLAVVAAGNAGDVTDVGGAPGSASAALTVAASNGGATVASFSSRGVHGSLGVVKPDVTAPGVDIVSAAQGTAAGATALSGTSMATPHVAGIAALVKKAHPDWSPTQLKAAIVNTAGGPLGPHGPARIGSGLVNALAATSTTVLAYAPDPIGPVEVPAGTTATLTREVTVENSGDTEVTFTASYVAATTQPGVTFGISPSTMTILAGDSEIVTLTLTATADDLRRTIDPTMTGTTSVGETSYRRAFIPDASGWLTLTPTGANPQTPTLRVPVYAAPKPVSQMHATAPDPTAITLTGTGVDTATGGGSLAAVFALGATSPHVADCANEADPNCPLNETAKAADLRYVGAAAPAAPGSNPTMLYFALATHSPWAAIGAAIVPVITIDTGGTSAPEYRVEVRAASYKQGNTTVRTDVLRAELYSTAASTMLSSEPINPDPATQDRNIYDSTVMIVPVPLAAIGLSGSGGSLRYTVTMQSYYAPGSGSVVDSAGPVTFNMASPAVRTPQIMYDDMSGTTIPVTVANPNAATQALVLHLHNAAGATQAEVVTIPRVASPPSSPPASPGGPGSAGPGSGEPAPEPPAAPEPAPEPAPAPAQPASPAPAEPAATATPFTSGGAVTARLVSKELDLSSCAPSKVATVDGVYRCRTAAGKWMAACWSLPQLTGKVMVCQASPTGKKLVAFPYQKVKLSQAKAPKKPKPWGTVDGVPVFAGSPPSALAKKPKATGSCLVKKQARQLADVTLAKPRCSGSWAAAKVKVNGRTAANELVVFHKVKGKWKQVNLSKLCARPSGAPAMLATQCLVR